MAMNKKERDALVAAQRDARLARALTWATQHLGDLEPDIPVPVAGAGKKTFGWVVRGHGIESRVYFAASSSIAHYVGNEGEVRRWAGGSRDYSGSQGGIVLHSTRLRALLAARQALEIRFAAALSAVDEQINAEREAS